MHRSRLLEQFNNEAPVYYQIGQKIKDIDGWEYCDYSLGEGHEGLAFNHTYFLGRQGGDSAYIMVDGYYPKQDMITTGITGNPVIVATECFRESDELSSTLYIVMDELCRNVVYEFNFYCGLIVIKNHSNHTATMSMCHPTEKDNPITDYLIKLEEDNSKPSFLKFQELAKYLLHEARVHAQEWSDARYDSSPGKREFLNALLSSDPMLWMKAHDTDYIAEKVLF